MKIYGLYLYQLIVTVIAVNPSVYGKTLFQRSVSDNDLQGNLEGYNSALKSVDKLASYRSVTANKDSDDEGENQSSIVSASFKVPKINTQGTQCYDVASSKRSTEDDLKGAGNLSPHLKYKRRRSPYGVVYNQGRPIGILEPISRLYEFQDVEIKTEEDASAPAKRELESSNHMSDTNQFIDASSAIAPDNTKYANVLTNFKIGHRLKLKQLGEDAPLIQNVEKKHERTVNKRSLEAEMSKLATTSTKAKRDLSVKNLAELEENLKQIMTDLGLTKDEKISKRDIKSNKRGALGEDEDLEAGMNKIGLTKELHTDERNKKENFAKSYADSSMLHGNNKPTRKGGENIVPSEDVSIVGDPMNKKAKKNKIADYRSEGESVIRKKRQQTKTSENTDLMKGLETSGDLTVSGNKSPLASSSTAALDSDAKHKIANEKREKQTEDSEYEKRLERNIQKKLTKIKDEVKREIKSLKDQKAPVLNIPIDKKAEIQKTIETKRDANVKGKTDEKGTQKGAKSRKKRNLLDKETNKLNPSFNIEEPQVPHIRKRRDAASNDLDSNESNAPQDMENNNDQKDNRVTWHEMNDEEKAMGDLNKREGLNEAEPIKKSHHNPNNYQFQYRTKRKDDFKVPNEQQELKSNVKNNQDGNTKKSEQLSLAEEQKDVEKRNFKDNAEVDSHKVDKSTGDDSGFWDVQNQNVAKMVENQATRAVVPRESEIKNAPAATAIKDKVPTNKGALNNGMDTEKLEKLVSEGSPLTQSAKIERGTKPVDVPNIEIELHTGKEAKPIAPKSNQTKREKQKEDDKTTETDEAKLEEDKNETKEKRDSKKATLDSMLTKNDKLDSNGDKENIITKRSAKSDVHKIENSNQQAKEKAVRAIKDDKSKLGEHSKLTESQLSDENIKLVENLNPKINQETAKPETKREQPVKNDADIKIAGSSDSNLNIKLVGEDAIAIKNRETVNVADDKIKNQEDKSVKLVDAPHTNVDANDLQKRSTVDDSVAAKQNKQIYNDLQKVAKNSIDPKDLNQNSKLAESSNGARLGRSSEDVRGEHPSAPNLSLEEMQRLDSENNSKRKRRQAEYYNSRDKRNDFHEPTNMQFKTYRGDEDEADDESDEFDDDNFDDRTANLIRKRAAQDNSNYEDFDEDYETAAANNEEHQPGRVNKRNTYLRNYVANMNSDVYDNPNYLYEGNVNSRKKRGAFTDLVALHSGGPMLSHLAAAKERSMQPIDTTYRKKRLEKFNQKQNKQQTITGLSESDIFGGLPQSYEGELTRFKRVKRDDSVDKSN